MVFISAGEPLGFMVPMAQCSLKATAENLQYNAGLAVEITVESQNRH
jgi:hypothetical protein